MEKSSVKTPLEVLVETKLTELGSNEHAAEIALLALSEAGYKITRSDNTLSYINRTTVENYRMYVCPVCSFTQIVNSRKAFIINEKILCVLNGCKGVLVPIDVANEIQQAELT